jgi:hypothetical protein
MGWRERDTTPSRDIVACTREALHVEEVCQAGQIQQ